MKGAEWAGVDRKMRLEWNDEEVLRDIGKITGKVEKKGAQRVVRDARRYCPKEKGFYLGGGKTDKWGNRPGSARASIRIQKSKFKGGGYLVMAGGKGPWGDPFYVPFVELGTPGTTYQTKEPKRSGARIAVQAHPFMRKALARNKRRIRQMFREAMK